jgi:hypothetical protein
MKSSVFWDITPYGLLTFNGQYDIISQKRIHFITTAVRNSNPTHYLIFKPEVSDYKVSQFRSYQSQKPCLFLYTTGNTRSVVLLDFGNGNNGREAAVL